MCFILCHFWYGRKKIINNWETCKSDEIIRYYVKAHNIDSSLSVMVFFFPDKFNQYIYYRYVQLDHHMILNLIREGISLVYLC
jgi:hypothetical protein